MKHPRVFMCFNHIFVLFRYIKQSYIYCVYVSKHYVLPIKYIESFLSLKNEPIAKHMLASLLLVYL